MIGSCYSHTLALVARNLATFNQFQLVDACLFLFSAELALFSPMGRPSHSPHGGHDLGASYLSPGQRHHGNVVSVLSMQFAELEGPGFQYQPLFHEETIRMVDVIPIGSLKML